LASWRYAEERQIEPYCIFQSEKTWRLLAKNSDEIKQFFISRIDSVEILEQKFIPLSREVLEEIFSTSFGSWLGNDKFTVKLRLFAPWADRIKSKQMMEYQNIVDNPDGSVDLELIVNSLDETASWIVSKGKGIVVLEPDILKQTVIEIAEAVNSNYSNINHTI
jgi:predicted DNA-binding transcriptional regulator YafY